MAFYHAKIEKQPASLFNNLKSAARPVDPDSGKRLRLAFRQKRSSPPARSSLRRAAVKKYAADFFGIGSVRLTVGPRPPPPARPRYAYPGLPPHFQFLQRGPDDCFFASPTLPGSTCRRLFRTQPERRQASLPQWREGRGHHQETQTRSRLPVHSDSQSSSGNALPARNCSEIIPASNAGAFGYRANCRVGNHSPAMQSIRIFKVGICAGSRRIVGNVVALFASMNLSMVIEPRYSPMTTSRPSDQVRGAAAWKFFQGIGHKNGP